MANLINGFYQVNVGSNPNDGTGDSFRDCFIATNINWGKVGNAGIGNTALSFTNSTISAPAGNNINLVVSGGYVNLGNAGSILVGDSGNVLLGNGLTGQFLRASDTTGNIYWSGGASGANGMVQYNQSGAFGAQSSFTYDSAIGKLSVQNIATANDIVAGGNLTVNDIAARDLIGRNFNFAGDGVIVGNFTVIGNVTAANTTTLNVGNSLITIANAATSIVLLEQAGITWGNSSLLGTGNTPNIRFRDIGGSNIQQTVLAIYPGIWTQGLYVSASAAPVAANLAPGRITLAADVQLAYQNAANAAAFSNLQADVFKSTSGNITTLVANTADITTNASNGSAVAGRLLKIRNTSAISGNVGLQIVNQSGSSNSAWDIFSRSGNGTLTFGWATDGNGTGSSMKLEISNSGNVQIPYSTATNSFIGFGPGNAAHAGMRYVGSEYTLHLEANGTIDRLQLGTNGSTRVTILGNSVAATAGFVGILNSSPISPLTVTGNTNGNRLQSGLTVSRTGLYSGSYTLGVDNSNNQFFIADSSAGGSGITRLAITATGNVEVGNLTTSGLIVGSFAPRVSTNTTIASPLTVNSDNYDIYAATAQAGNLVINADVAAPADGKKLIFRITSDSSARTITFTGGTVRGYKPIGVALTAAGNNWNYTTTANKTTYFDAIYNSASGRWEIVDLSQEI